MQPNAKGIYEHARKTILPPNLVGKKRHAEVRERDGLGPGQYTIKNPKKSGYSMGNRLDTRIKGKLAMPAHLKAMEKIEPGPG